MAVEAGTGFVEEEEEVGFGGELSCYCEFFALFYVEAWEGVLVWGVELRGWGDVPSPGTPIMASA